MCQLFSPLDNDQFVYDLTTAFDEIDLKALYYHFHTTLIDVLVTMSQKLIGPNMA